jgi:predicted nucleic acid-binding Zn ribbon protein
VVARKSVPNAEVDLSIRTWRRHQGQAPCHQCD